MWLNSMLTFEAVCRFLKKHPEDPQLFLLSGSLWAPGCTALRARSPDESQANFKKAFSVNFLSERPKPRRRRACGCRQLCPSPVRAARSSIFPGRRSISALISVLKWPQQPDVTWQFYHWIWAKPPSQKLWFHAFAAAEGRTWLLHDGWPEAFLLGDYRAQNFGNAFRPQQDPKTQP